MVTDIDQIAQVLLDDFGACLDCGCPLRSFHAARGHAEGRLCIRWTDEGCPGHNRYTMVHEDGSYSLGVINEDDEVDDDHAC